MSFSLCICTRAINTRLTTHGKCRLKRKIPCCLLILNSVNEFGQVGDVAAVEKIAKKETPAAEKSVEAVATKASGSAQAGTATKRK